MTIAINFRDNDFHATFRNLMETLRNCAYWRGVSLEDMDRSQILTIINELAWPCYLAFQAPFRDFDLEKEEHYRGYLKVKDHNLFIKDQVHDYLRNEDTFFNGNIVVMAKDVVYIV